MFNTIENDCDARDFFKRKFLRTQFTVYQVYFTFLEPLIVWCVPGLLILVMNAYVIFKIIKSNRRRRNNQFLGELFSDAASAVASNIVANNSNNNNINNNNKHDYINLFALNKNINNIKTHHETDTESRTRKKTTFLAVGSMELDVGPTCSNQQHNSASSNQKRHFFKSKIYFHINKQS